MSEDVDPVLRRLLAPARCSLLVVDKQRWYLDPEVSPFEWAGPPEAALVGVAALDRFIDAGRRCGVPVCWTRMTEGDSDAPANVQARFERRSRDPRLRRGDPGYAFAGSGPVAGEPVVAKVYPDAFSASELEGIVTANERSTVVIVGGYAGRCVLASAFGAQALGLDVVIPRGLVEPHPAVVAEEAVVLSVIDSVVGHVVAPDVIERCWGAGADP